MQRLRDHRMPPGAVCIARPPGRARAMGIPRPLRTPALPRPGGQGRATGPSPAPLAIRAKPGGVRRRVAAGPSGGLSFHVVGGQFDTVHKEGAYLLRPGGPEQGGAQALSRSLYASLVPASRSGEFFGLFSVFSRFGGVLGPAAMGLVTRATGSSRYGIAASRLEATGLGETQLLVETPDATAEPRNRRVQIVNLGG